jgi:hypothetical protein
MSRFFLSKESKGDGTVFTLLIDRVVFNLLVYFIDLVIVRWRFKTCANDISTSQIYEFLQAFY